MPRSLVTGGAGFIGSHVADELLARGHAVDVVDDLTGGFAENVPEGARFREGSVTDAAFVRDLFSQSRYDYVFHLAAYAAEGLSHFIRRFNYTNNVIGSMNLLDAAVNADVRCYVFSSSIAVYGEAPLPMTEDTVPRPVDPYGIAKYAVEMDLRAAHELFGLNFIVFRPHNVYGERQNIGDRYRNVIGIFMNQILQGELMTVFGDGEQTRAFTHIADVAPVIAESVNRPEALNQVFNVGADTPYSVNRLAEIVARAMGAETRLRHLPARHEVVHAYSSHEKAGRLLDYRPSVSLEDGIGRMAAWVRKHGARTSKSFSDIEIRKSLPPSWAEESTS
jgi:UDP-glucose 4-epimerase